MSSYQSRPDLENQAPGGNFLPSYPQNVDVGQINNLVLIYLKQIADLMVELKELTRKSRNLLWQIDEKLSNPRNESEFDVEPHDLEDK